MISHSPRTARAVASLVFAVLVTLLLACSFTASRAQAQADTFLTGDGHEGNYTVGTSGIMNYVAPVTAAATAGSSTLTIGTIRNGTLDAADTQFEANRLVLVIQTTGYTGSATSGDQTAKDISSDAVARWELARVSTTAGTPITTLNLSAPLVNSYAANNTQVVAVPEYGTLTVSNNRTASAHAWDGSSGGITAFLATGAVTLNGTGTISAAASGFRGGTGVNGTGSNCNQMDGAVAGRKGEGIVPSAWTLQGRGNKANAAGGGNCENSGGAGGGHGGTGGAGGDAYAGGSVGGIGGSKLTYSIFDHMAFGGGGGAGDENNSVGGDGGAGGGTVFIRGASLAGSATSTITATGGAGGASSNASNGDGAGGGGAGGSIYARFTGAVTCNIVTAAGGNGGNETYASGVHGPGGGGAGGKIVLQGSSVGCTPNVSNGVAGVAGTGGAQGNRNAGPSSGGDVVSSGDVATTGGGLAAPTATQVNPAAAATVGRFPIFTGTATAGATVAVYVDSVLNGTATADIAGNWSYTPSVALSGGAHTWYVQPTYQGIVGTATGTRAMMVDATAPAQPTITSPANNSYTTDNTPTLSGAAEANSTVTIYDGVTSLGTATATAGGAWTFTTGALADAAHAFTVTATDAYANMSVASATTTVTVDTTSPAVSISSPTAGAYVATTTPAVTFTATDTNISTRQCKIDSAAYANCTSPYTPAALSQGPHTAYVQATDLAGNQTTASVAFTVDTVGPVVSISSPAVSGWTSSATPAVSFTATDATSSVTGTVCTLDSGTYVACTSPWTASPAMTAGSHTVSVRATDSAGNITTTTNTFTVDLTNPVVTISSPANNGHVQSATPTITFSATDTNISTRQCRVDGGAYGACTSTTTYVPSSLSVGSHTVDVLATDLSGRQTTGSVTFTVDLTNPAVSITSPASGAYVNSTTPSVTFTATDTNLSTVQCRADSGSYTTCTSPYSPTLGQGSHTVNVLATDISGRQTTGAVTFTVDTVDPAVTISAPANGAALNTNSPSVTFSVTEPNIASQMCSTDGAAYAACTSPHLPGPLGDGSHTVSVRVIDQVGRTTTATTTFTIDTSGPAVSISSPANGGWATSATPAVTFTATDTSNPVTTTCRIDSGTPAACTSPWTAPSMTAGSHSVTVVGTDALGNTTTVVNNFTVDLTSPVVTISAPANGAFLTSSPTVTYSASDANSFSVQCRIDSGSYGACTTGTTHVTSGLSQGSHSVSVQATDASGRVTTSTVNFTVDSGNPTVSISAPSAGWIQTATPSVTFGASDPVTTVSTTCAVDSGSYSSCTSPWTPPALADGTRTLRVRATDQAGNLTDTAVVVNVDTIDPALTISSPANNSYFATTTSQAITFNTSDANTLTTVCKLDSGSFGACSTATTFMTGVLTAGVHTVTVRSTDLSGRYTERTVDFTVDLTDPVVTFTSPTAGAVLATNSTTVNFTVTETNPDTLQCKLDTGAYGACTSGTTFATGPLTDGTHNVSVLATDLSGRNVTSVLSFTIDTTAPAISFSAPASGAWVTTTTPTVSFTVTEPNPSSTQCKLDSGSFGACTTPATFAPGPLAQGPHTVTVEATDAVSHTTSQALTFNVDSILPAVSISAPANGAYVQDATPTITYSASDANPITTVCKVDSDAFGACTTGATHVPSALSAGPHSVTVQSTDSAGLVGSAVVAFTVDLTAPVVSIGSPSDGAVLATSSTTVNFGVVETNPGTTQCKLDSGSFGACTTATTFATGPLTDGLHSVEVLATDLSGRTHSSTVNFTIDTTDPVVSFSSPAAGGTVANASPTVTFSATDANILTRQCKLDSGSFGACSTTTTLVTSGLFEGGHTVQVQATDAAGHVATETLNFTVDTVNPTLSISAPASNAVLGTTTPAISFSGSDATALAYQCRVDGGSFAACSSPFTTAVLSQGAHTVYVQATDAAGNTSPVVSVGFTVDTVNPTVSISSPASGATTGATPSISFSGSDATAMTYECRTDSGSWGACTSPFTTASLGDGPHLVSVRATDAAGNLGSATTVNFTVDTTNPSVSISSPIAGAVTGATPAVTFTASDAGSWTATCAVDGGSFAACSSPWTPSTLADGSHTLRVRITDSGGNITNTNVVVTVDTTAPVLTISSPAASAFVSTTTPAVTFGATDATAVTFRCKTESTAFAACTAPSFTPAALGEGSHTVTIEATDAGGNVTTSTRTFTVDTIDPAVSISAPANNAWVATNSPTITFSATDTNLTSTQCKLDSGSYGACTTGTTFVTGTLAAGSHTVTVLATDAAGRSSQSSVSFTIDLTDPAVSISSPSSGAVLATTAPTVTYSATDANIATRQCKLDSGSFASCTTDTTFATGTIGQGSHTVTVRGTDLAGRSTDAVVTFTVDTLDPSLTISAPAQGAAVSTATPSVSFGATDATAVTYTCATDGGAAAPCTSPFTTGTLADGAHSVTVTATDAGGNSSDETVSFSVDTGAPAVSISSPSAGATLGTSTPSISFIATDTTGSPVVTCSVDGGAYAPCSSPFAAGTLGDGSHTVSVRAVDGAGNTTTSSVSFTVDTTDPSVSISAPAGGAALATTTPGITFGGSDATALAYECTVDGGAYAPCSSVFTTPALGQGAHTVTVRATDAGGNTATDSVSFTVDTTDPSVSISAPADGSDVSTDTPSITFGATDATALTHECKVDGGSFAPCTSPFTTGSLGDGDHTVTIRATDAAGNSGESSTTFTVDTGAPTVSISSPDDGDVLGDDTPTVTFSASDTHLATVECSVDAATFAPCSSPFTTPSLGDGAHSVTVRATDDAGNTTSSTVNLTVDTADPVVSISSPANGALLGTTTPSVSFGATDVTAVTYACKIDSGSFAPCASPFTTPSLSQGAHTATVLATDAGGNTGQASVSFTVDSAAPAVSIASPANGSHVDTDAPSVAFGATDASAVTHQCKVDGGSFTSCSSPFATGSLTEGTHTVTVEATDAAGNSGQASTTFTVDTTNPSVAITSPAAGANLATVTPAVSYTVTETNLSSTTCTVDSTVVACAASPMTLPSLTDGAHTFTVEVEDAAGNTDQASVSFTVDTTAPVIAITAPSDGSTTGSAAVQVTFGVTDTTPTTTRCKVDGGAYVPCTSPFTTTVLADGPHTIYVEATDGIGNVTVESVDVTVDTLNPIVSISSPAVSGTVGDATPDIVFGSSDAGATLTCQVDGGAFVPCGSPFTTPSLSEGSHTVVVKATNGLGNSGTDSVTFTVDTTNPGVTITSPASGALLGSATPSVAFTITDASAASAQCAVDGGAFGACSSPFTTPSLADGAHSVAVMVTDAGGNATTSTVSFDVDTQAPVINLVSPVAFSEYATPTPLVQFVATDASAVATHCSIDLAAFFACSSPSSLPALGEGSHNLRVRATDALGHFSIEQVTFVVDTIAPVISISSPASGATLSDDTPTVSFGVIDADSSPSVLCAVDSVPVSGCSSPFTTALLADGPHSVVVSATDHAGNYGTRTVNFSVDTSTPDTLLDSAPSALSTSNNATIAFHSDDATAGFECDVDSGGYAACSSPLNLSSLSEGAHDVKIRARDAAGNTDATPVTVSWTVDTVAPAAPAITSPADLSSTADDTPAIGGTADAGTTITVYDDATAIGATTADGSGNWSFTPGSALADGTRNLTARSSDAAGNESGASNLVRLTIDSSAPDTAIGAKPPSRTNSTAASLSFTADETATFECKLDGGAWTPCTSPEGYSGLSEAVHSFSVRATDALGNVELSPASYSWTVDTTAPAVPAVSSPADGDLSNDPTPDVTGTGEPGSEITVIIDGTPRGTVTVAGDGTWTFPVTPALTDGPHTVAAKAKDEAGNESSNSVTVTVTTDTAAPDLTVDPQTGGSTTSAPTYDIASSDATATFTCSVDGGAFAPCSSPFTPGTSSVGSHSLIVRARDVAGNVTDRTVNFSISGSPSTPVTPPSTPSTPSTPPPAAPDPQCEANAVTEGTPAKITVNSAIIIRKKLLVFSVSADQFAIARMTVKNGSKKVGSQIRAVTSGKRLIVVPVGKRLPKKNASMLVRLSSISMTGGHGVASAKLNVDAAGKLTLTSLSGTVGTPITSVGCGAERGGQKVKVKMASQTKVAGSRVVKVTASASQFAVSTFTVVQNGKVIGRKVFVIKPKQKLKRPIKLLGASKLVKGKYQLIATTFSVDGVKVVAKKNLKVK